MSSNNSSWAWSFEDNFPICKKLEDQMEQALVPNSLKILKDKSKKFLLENEANTLVFHFINFVPAGIRAAFQRIGKPVKLGIAGNLFKVSLIGGLEKNFTNGGCIINGLPVFVRPFYNNKRWVEQRPSPSYCIGVKVDTKLEQIKAWWGDLENLHKVGTFWIGNSKNPKIPLIKDPINFCVRNGACFACGNFGHLKINCPCRIRNRCPRCKGNHLAEKCQKERLKVPEESYTKTILSKAKTLLLNNCNNEYLISAFADLAKIVNAEYKKKNKVLEKKNEINKSIVDISESPECSEIDCSNSLVQKKKKRKHSPKKKNENKKNIGDVSKIFKDFGNPESKQILKSTETKDKDMSSPIKTLSNDKILFDNKVASKKDLNKSPLIEKNKEVLKNNKVLAEKKCVETKTKGITDEMADKAKTNKVKESPKKKNNNEGPHVVSSSSSTPLNGDC